MKKNNILKTILSIVASFCYILLIGTGAGVVNALGAITANGKTANGNYLKPTYASEVCNATEPISKPKLAIVIDDFGEDRRGVEEMLNINARLTIAVMPADEFSTEDAEKAHAKGHEVILHMPMENETYAPANYYGPVLIKNSYSPDEARKVLAECIDKTPHCKGVNIHMGTGVSKNKAIITELMKEVKSRDMFFLDSKTVMGSVCPECAKEVGTKFYDRDVFLEPPGRPNYARAVSELYNAVKVAQEKGKAVAIGHIGPVGTTETARAIADNLEKILAMGIEIVPLSEL